MNVSLTKELENFIGELVANGMYFFDASPNRDCRTRIERPRRNLGSLF